MPPTRERTDEARPAIDETDTRDVGAQLTLTQDHLAGSHLMPRPECWRCQVGRREDEGPDA